MRSFVALAGCVTLALAAVVAGCDDRPLVDRGDAAGGAASTPTSASSGGTGGTGGTGGAAGQGGAGG